MKKIKKIKIKMKKKLNHKNRYGNSNIIQSEENNLKNYQYVMKYIYIFD